MNANLTPWQYRVVLSYTPLSEVGPVILTVNVCTWNGIIGTGCLNMTRYESSFGPECGMHAEYSGVNPFIPTVAKWQRDPLPW